MMTFLKGLWNRKPTENPNNRNIGNWGEREATLYLRRNGYRIVSKNWRLRMGEIDIIAQKDRETIFVEVKSGERPSAIGPEWRVGAKKQRKLRALAGAYLQGASEKDISIRFDVISVWREGDETKIQHFENAF
jgi:putative endonuclease